MGPPEEPGVTHRIRVLIVDDHSVVRRGLRRFLEDDPQLEIVGEASDGEEGVRLARETRPDVVLMDLLLPKLGGIEATEKIRHELPDTQVIALTSVLEDASVVGAVKAGAIGYLLKNTEGDELLNAIHAAAEGQVRLSPEASARLLREVRAPQSDNSTFWVRGVVARRVCPSVDPSAEAAQWLSKDTRFPARLTCSSATTTHQLGVLNNGSNARNKS